MERDSFDFVAAGAEAVTGGADTSVAVDDATYLVELQQYLHKHIPLSAAMGVEVKEAADEGVCLTAPLEPNINHRSTVFGGSAAAVGILAGWTLLHVRLGHVGRASRIVIQRTIVDYHDPINGAFEAVALPPADEEWNRFTRLLDRRGRSRLDLRVELRRDGQVLGECLGTYVVLPPDPEEDASSSCSAD